MDSVLRPQGLQKRLQRLRWIGRLGNQKKHPFQLVTTRRYYAGPHRVEIQVNGVILDGANFKLEL